MRSSRDLLLQSLTTVGFSPLRSWNLGLRRTSWSRRTTLGPRIQ